MIRIALLRSSASAAFVFVPLTTSAFVMVHVLSLLVTGLVVPWAGIAVLRQLGLQLPAS